MAANGEHDAAQTLDRLASQVRVASGPRMAAYYAALDALGGLGDRVRVKATDLRPLTSPRGDDGRRRIDDIGFGGAVASIAKTGKGVRVSFVTTRRQVMSQHCVETNRIDRVLADGKLVYRRACTDTGLVWVDTTPRPVTIATPYAAALAVGRFAQFDDSMSDDVIPLEVFAEKVGTHMIAVCGFVLE